ncbi:MAG: hypothetical protein R2684_08620 [Pyrinomonadaceae bacterium]
MKMAVRKLILGAVVFALYLTSQPANAASPGSLDPSFGIAGKIRTPGLGTAADVAVQDDGKIVVVGDDGNTNSSSATVRYTSEGVLDPTFGNNGVAIQALQSTSGRGKSVAIQTDKKIVIIGSDDISCTAIRFNPSGTLDAGFGSNGRIVLPSLRECRKVIIQPDGKIAIVGNSPSPSISVVRLNANGTLDTAFGTNGVASTGLAGNGNSIGIDRVNKLVVVGSKPGTVPTGGVIARFQTNGTLDTGFSGDGLITVDDIFTGFNDVAVDYSGANTVTVVGEVRSKSAIHRYDNSGSLDTTFNGTGKIEEFINNRSGTLTSISLQSDRKLIISGEADLNKIALIRINRNGTLDSGFGENGLSVTDIQLGESSFFAGRAEISGSNIILANPFEDNVREFRLSKHNLTITPSQSGDFDGDGFGDIAVYRPSQGLWIILNSSDSSVVFKQFGLNGDIPIDGDFDGDGKNDLAIFRPSNGLWFVERSSDGTNFAREFGTSSDKPSTDDYDKDGKADLAFFRPSSGEWFILRSSDGFNSFFSFPFGTNGDIPIVKKGP